MKNYMIGTRFYRYDNDSGLVEIIRLKKIISEGKYLFDTGYRDLFLPAIEFSSLVRACLLIKTSKTCYVYHYHDIYGNKIVQTWELIYQGESTHKFRIKSTGITLTEDELDKYYTKLIPDGFIVSGIISYRTSPGRDLNKDILMTVHKDKDSIPAIICRQDINSPRDNQNDIKPLLGGSIYLKEYPELNPDSLLSYNYISHKKLIAIYAEDTVNTILHYMSPVHKYNVFLNQLYYRFDNYKHYRGLTKNMYEFLNSIYFYHDFASLFGIGLYPLPLSIDRDEMNEKEVMMFNGLFSKGEHRYNLLRYQPYSRQIDISDSNILPIRDSCNGSDVGDLFIVTMQSDQ